MKALLLGTVLAVTAAGQTFTVAGVVVDAAHRVPVSRARVTLLGGVSAKQAFLTGADGRFSFSVPQGKYNLLAERNEWRIQYGNLQPQPGFGSAIIVGPDQDTANLTFAWHPPAAIFGRIADEEGDAVRDATVQLITVSVVAGRKRILPAQSTRTDDRGEYRFGPLPAGTYYVVARGRPPQALEQLIAPPRQGEAAHSQTSTSYPPTYFPGTIDSSRASPITLASGAEQRADIPLRATAGATVHVRCPGSSVEGDQCQGASTLSLHGIGDLDILQPAGLAGTPGAYAGVPPGRYTVRVNVGTRTAMKMIDVGGGDVTVDLALQDRKPVIGTLKLNNSAVLPRTGIYVALDHETTARGVGAAVAADGTFTFNNTGGDRFRLRVYGSVPLALVEASADGTALPDAVVDLTEYSGAHLEIVATNELGRLKGFAMNGGRPAPAVLAVLVPRVPSPMRPPLGFQTESDGSFDYQNVPAGDYLLFAVDRTDLEYANPDAIQPYLADATPVHIQSRAVAEQRVALH